MKVVACIVGRKQIGWLPLIAHRSVKINHRIESAAFPNPIVDGLTSGFVRRAEIFANGQTA